MATLNHPLQGKASRAQLLPVSTQKPNPSTPSPLGGRKKGRQRDAAPPFPPAGLVCRPSSEVGRNHREEEGECLWAESASALARR